VLVSEVEFKGSMKVGKYFLSQDKFEKYDDELYYYIYGEIFSDQNRASILNAMLSGDKDFFLKVIGEYSIILYDVKENKIFILNDKTGRNLIYYSTKNHLSIGENFWGIVKYNQFTVNDVSKDLLKENVCFYVSLQYHTLFKELNILPNATYTVIEKSVLNIEKYWYFKLEKNSYTIEEKYDMLGDSFNRTMSKISKFYDDSTIHGIGVSGGMDSRLVPYYAFKNNMRMHSYIIGEEKPNKFFKSNDHISSDLVVDYFKLKHQKLDYNELSYKEKNRLDAIYNPIGTSQIFKIPNIEKIDFDILQTGASGFIVGASPFYSSVRNLPLEILIFDKQSSLKLRKKFVRLFKGINYIVGKDIFDTKDKIQLSIDGLITKEEVSTIEKHLKSLLSDMKELTASEKLMNYAIGILGHRNKSGSFESLINHKENYSLYTTYTLEMMKYLNEDELYDRKLFEDFIKERLPELASIKGQDHKTSLLNATPKFFQKLWSIGMFALRGNGVMNYHNWVKSKAFISYVHTTLNEYDYVSKYFDIDKILKITKTGELNSIIITNIMKHNEVMYIVDNIDRLYDGLYKDK
jgi:hypothetical protein